MQLCSKLRKPLQISEHTWCISWTMKPRPWSSLLEKLGFCVRKLTILNISPRKILTPIKISLIKRLIQVKPRTQVKRLNFKTKRLMQRCLDAVDLSDVKSWQIEEVSVDSFHIANYSYSESGRTNLTLWHWSEMKDLVEHREKTNTKRFLRLAKEQNIVAEKSSSIIALILKDVLYACDVLEMTRQFSGDTIHGKTDTKEHLSKRIATRREIQHLHGNSRNNASSVDPKEEREALERDFRTIPVTTMTAPEPRAMSGDEWRDKIQVRRVT